MAFTTSTISSGRLGRAFDRTRSGNFWIRFPGRGKHFLKIGTEIDRRNVTFGQARAPRGAFGFDGTYTGSALADFMLRYVKTANINPTHI